MSAMKLCSVSVIAAVGLLTACSSSGGGATGSTTSPAVNPVDVLRKIPGCDLPPTASVGDRVGAVGYASCMVKDPDASASDGDQVTAYVSTDDSALQQELHTQGDTSTDSTKIIVGYRFFLTDTGSLDPATGGVIYRLPVADVASAVGGTLR